MHDIPWRVYPSPAKRSTKTLHQAVLFAIGHDFLDVGPWESSHVLDMGLVICSHFTVCWVEKMNWFRLARRDLSLICSFPAVYNTSVSQHEWTAIFTICWFDSKRSTTKTLLNYLHDRVITAIDFSQHKQHILSTVGICMNNYAIKGLLVLQYGWQHVASPLGLKNQTIMNLLEFVRNTVELNFDRHQNNPKVKRFLPNKTQWCKNLNWSLNALLVWCLDPLELCLKLKLCTERYNTEYSR